MKTKIILNLAIISIVGILFSSCKKDASLTENQKAEFNIENGMLAFESPEAFDKILENWSAISFDQVLVLQQKEGFKSLYSDYKTKNNLMNLPCDDKFFPLVLSTDNKIKIGDYVFTFDFTTETCIAQNNLTKKTEKFTFDDDAIPYLFEGQPLEKIDYCNARRINVMVYKLNTGYEGWVRYYNAVVYRSLYSEFDCAFGRMYTIDDFYWKTKDMSFAVKGHFDIQIPEKNQYVSIYKGTARLTSYHVNVQYEIENYDSKPVLNDCRND